VERDPHVLEPSGGRDSAGGQLFQSHKSKEDLKKRKTKRASTIRQRRRGRQNNLEKRHGQKWGRGDNSGRTFNLHCEDRKKNRLRVEEVMRNGENESQKRREPSKDKYFVTG